MQGHRSSQIEGGRSPLSSVGVVEVLGVPLSDGEPWSDGVPLLGVPLSDGVPLLGVPVSDGVPEAGVGRRQEVVRRNSGTRLCLQVALPD